MKMSSMVRRAVATVLPRVEASACIPPTHWTECDTITTSTGQEKVVVDCQTSCAGTTTCTPTGALC